MSNKQSLVILAMTVITMTLIMFTCGGLRVAVTQEDDSFAGHWSGCQ